MAEKDKVEILKAHCNQCGGERRHELLHHETIRGSEVVDKRFAIDWADRYEMLKCCGCENVAMRHLHWFSEDMGSDGRPTVYTSYYPPATSRREPRWLELVDDMLAEDEQLYVVSLLREIYSALHNDARRLASMGIRALIEHMMIHKVGDTGTFGGNLQKFESDGFISSKQKERLETILDAGHAAIHRAFHPSKEDLNILMDITESVVETVYAHEDKTKLLRKRVPPRNKTGKKGT